MREADRDTHWNSPFGCDKRWRKAHRDPEQVTCELCIRRFFALRSWQKMARDRKAG